MAGLNGTNLTLIDVAKRTDPDGGIATDIAEMLTQRNEILQDAVWKETNMATAHRVTIRAGLPVGTWRRFNQGVARSKSITVQVDEACAMLEQRGAVDKDIAMLNGNTPEFRLSENVPHIDAMNIDMATALFYSDATSQPEKFYGLAPRYSALTGFANSVNVLSAGGNSSDTASIWLVGWGDKSIFCLYPKGSKAGIQHTPIKDGSPDGCVDVLDGSNNPYRAYADHYQWKTGLAVKDWRYAVRVANIDISDLMGKTGTQATTASTNIVELMSRAIDRIPDTVGVKLAFYCNRTIFSGLKIQALARSTNALSIEDALVQFGSNSVKKKELQFLGIPIRICDSLVNNETVLT